MKNRILLLEKVLSNRRIFYFAMCYEKFSPTVSSIIQCGIIEKDVECIESKKCIERKCVFELLR